MTRLRAPDVHDIPEALPGFEAALRLMTGRGLFGLACGAAEVSEADAAARAPFLRVAVVPMTCGEGAIEGFSEALTAIAAHVGFQAFMADAPDVGGLAEALGRGADLILASDDDVFAALNIATRRVSDNSWATGVGFATALDAMTGGVAGRDVLLLGAGRVGRHAADHLARLGARLSIFDVQAQASEDLAARIRARHGEDVHMEVNISQALSRHRLILDATPAGGIIQANHVHPETFVAAPGVPCGLTSAAAERAEGRIFHDVLALGTAVMLVGAAFGEGRRKEEGHGKEQEKILPEAC